MKRLFSLVLPLCLIVSTPVLATETYHSFKGARPYQPVKYFNGHHGVYLGGTAGVGTEGEYKNERGDYSGAGIGGFAGTVFAGYQFTPYFGVEANFFSASAVVVLGGFSTYGATLRAIFPIGKRFSFYLKVGGGEMTLDPSFVESYSRAVVLIGTGFGLVLMRHLDLILDYMGGVFTDDVYGVLGFGLVYHFQ